MRVLGIETSCDETAAAVVEDGKRLLSNVVASSLDLQVPYGGVVPEIAARAQMEYITPVINEALKQAETDWKTVDGLAVTYGPGLGGSLLVGVLTARTLAIIHNKPLYAVNHVKAHVYANFLTEVAAPSVKSGKWRVKRVGNSSSLITPHYSLPTKAPAFPLLALIVSGGHTQLVLFKDHFKYKLLGQTHDDAVGEAFDKVAKIIGLPYPGGPSIEKLAPKGNAHAFKLPKAKMPGKYDFSFSGLKTAVLRTSQEVIGKKYDFPSSKIPSILKPNQQADIAASFQRVAIETLVDKTLLAYQEFKPKSVVIAGGVAASGELRRQLNDRLPIKIEYPDIKLCTDNGAMIAAAGCYQILHKQKPADAYTLDIEPNLSM